MNLTKEEDFRLQELESKAKEEFLSYSDFIPSDFLDEEEGKEWKQLFNKLFDVEKEEAK